MSTDATRQPFGQAKSRPEVAAAVADDGSCRSCGVTPAPRWDTPDGRVHLCPPCAALGGVGCS